MTETEIDTISRTTRYRFKGKDLLEEAFVHRSYINERPGKGLRSNERLEFLGDAVLSSIISHLLMDIFPDMDEGGLSKIRATLVNERTLSSVAKRFGLGGYLLLGKGEEKSGGRERPSILADTLEALIGAVYLDGGYGETFRVVSGMFQPLIEEAGEERSLLDYKTLLQERVQKRYGVVPLYRVLDETGPEHDKTFHVEVSVEGELLGRGDGASKKEAQRCAARKALERLKLPAGGPGDLQS